MALVTNKEIVDIQIRKYIKDYLPIVEHLGTFIIRTENHDYLVKCVNEEDDFIEQCEIVNFGKFTSHFLLIMGLSEDGNYATRHYINNEFYHGKKYILDTTDLSYKYDFFK